MKIFKKKILCGFDFIELGLFAIIAFAFLGIMWAVSANISSHYQMKQNNQYKKDLPAQEAKRLENVQTRDSLKRIDMFYRHYLDEDE